MGNTYISIVAASLLESSLGHSSLGHSFGVPFGFCPQSTGDAKRLPLGIYIYKGIHTEFTLLAPLLASPHRAPGMRRGSA